jgi:hypothetical protein
MLDDPRPVKSASVSTARILVYAAAALIALFSVAVVVLLTR